MFAMPAPPPMLTKKEVVDLRGKLHRITKFSKIPKAQDPRIALPLSHLAISIKNQLDWQNFFFNPIHRNIIDHGIRRNSILEDVLVQIVVQGKDFDQVFAAAAAKPEGSFLQMYLVNNETIESITP